MIKNMINDLKLTAMDVVQDVKNTVHDMGTTLPSTVQTDYSKADSQNIQGQGTEYMSGWNGQSQMTATKIDMVADKISFVSEMIQQGLLAFDSIEQELVAFSRANTPPQPAQLVSLASRVDSNQKQIFMGLQKLKELSVEIDRATDKLQGASSWGSNNNSRW